jgi:arabinofuranosyltransferase
VLAAIALGFFAVILIRTAWICDDAYLTLRTVENAAAGHGLRWNVAERVQVYDHPLWLLILLSARLITRDTYFSTLGLSIGCSLLCLWLILRRARSEASITFAAAAMTLSPLFVSFATSGLESPLVHLLGVATVLAVWHRDPADRPPPVWLAILVSLTALTRWTVFLFAAPSLVAFTATATRRRKALSVLVAFAPVAIWSTWAFWYYGATVPNTWIADGTAGADWATRLSVGASFVRASAIIDPILAVLLIGGLSAGFGGDRSDVLMAASAAVVVVAVVFRGGHAQAGQDLTLPFLVGVMLAVRRLNVAPPRIAWGAALGIILLGWPMAHATVGASDEYGRDFKRTARTHDGRAEWYQSTGLLLTNRQTAAPRHPDADRARSLRGESQAVAISTNPGMFGIAAGPSVHVLDPDGRTDPLIARLPRAVGARWQWTVERRIPDGYEDALRQQASTGLEPSIGSLFAMLRLVTHARLTDSGRLSTLLRLPREVPKLVAASSYGAARVRLGDLGSSTVSPPFALREGGLIVELGNRRPLSRLTARLSARYDYEVLLLDDGDPVSAIQSPRASWGDAPDEVRSLDLNSRPSGNELWFRCGRGTGPCVVSELTIGD